MSENKPSPTPRPRRLRDALVVGCGVAWLPGLVRADSGLYSEETTLIAFGALTLLLAFLVTGLLRRKQENLRLRRTLNTALSDPELILKNLSQAVWI